MQAILKFNLPEETLEFNNASNGSKLHNIIFELDSYLRSEIKYTNNTEEVDLCLQKVRDRLNELCSNSGIIIYE